MRKKLLRFLSVILAIIMVISAMPITAFASDWDGSPSANAPSGSGTADEPYHIESAGDLKWFANQVNGSAPKSTSSLCAVLDTDIDLADQQWTPIGYYNSYSDCVFYAGTFDGNGHTVSGLYIDSSKQYQALIGYTKGAEIKNLTVSGNVKSSATSSSYAAGIVAYGNPVTIENCTNNASVTSESKGYIAGVAAGTTGGSKLTNCNNTADISGCGDYIGGIVGSATGSSSAGITSVSNCFNSGSITNSGKPSSYSYSTGGIAGSISGGSSVTMSGNTGNIKSTLKRTGGIVGSLGGSVEKCFNEGNVEGIYGVGGIAGDAADKTASITSCYNKGDVKAESPSVAFNDTNAKGAGGIIGGTASNSYMAVLNNCFNIGKITLQTNLDDVLAGGIIGDSSGKNYSAVETKDLVTADNCYYLDSSAEQGDGRNIHASGVVQKSSNEMKTDSFVSFLGNNFISNSDGGYPLLSWQNPNAKYDVKFTLSPSSAKLTVRDENRNIIDSDSLTYHLKNGTYFYTVSGEECEEVNGNFTVAYSEQNIAVSLKVKTYDFVFSTEPSDAFLTVDGQTPLADLRTYQLAKMGNPYTYKADAFGYEQATGTVNVTGNTDSDKLNISLKKQEQYKIIVPYSKENGGADSEVNIQITSDEYPNAVITQQNDKTFLLPSGNYTYTVSSSGYKSVKGHFTVDSSNITLPTAVLEIQTAWDGETITKPAQDSDGTYLITCPDELIWYQQNAPLNSSARLTADICINEDISKHIYEWSPIGINSSKAYTGDFDGNNHTISGIYISSKANNAGLFGFVGNEGKIHNLTISDSVVNAENANYVGGIVGDLKGSIDNCHITSSIKINGKSYVGGIVGELDTAGTVNACSNAGTVIAKSDTAGGIAGRIYSAASNALTNSVNTGDITAARYAGGIAGMLYNNATVENVYSTGSLTATNSYAGGLIGYFRCGTIRNAYTTGSINAAPNGGAFGFLDWPTGQKTANAVYCLENISDDAIGNTNGCTINGTVVFCTSAQLKIMAEALGDAFYENDTQQNSGYPLLYWQADKEMTNPDAPTPDPDGWNGKTSSTTPYQKDGIYQIGTPAELKWFAKASKQTPDIQGILTADIDLNYQPWTAIGGLSIDTAFAGIFDGNNFKIKNLYISSAPASALFAYNAGEIKNVTVEGIISNADNTAAIAVYNNGKISNVNSYVNIKGGNHTAGIAAYNEIYGEIANCRNFGNINGVQYSAGITSSNKGTVTDSANGGAVTGTNSFVGGVAADNDGGMVQNCANSGNIIGLAKVQYAYVGGVVGRNNSTVKNVYNCGNVVGLGSSVGGCIAINTIGSTSNGLYNAGDVCGSYIETENGEDFRVGGAIGEVITGVTNAYSLNTLTISTGGTLVSQTELNTLADSLTSMLPIKSNITGTASINSPQVGDTVKAEHSTNASQPIFIWYLFDGYDETVLSVDNEYTIPANLAGHRLYVKIIDASLSGIIKASSEPIDGFKGSVKINGYAVVGHTLTAVYTGSDSNPSYQWYRGASKIEGAQNASYKITDDDKGKILCVRVSGNKPGYIEKKTDKIKTADEAGIWNDDETDEPTLINSTYVISTEAELKWFASYVNAGNTTAYAKLANDIEITSSNWYPIGNSEHPYTGVFDGNNKTISNLSINSSSDEQGFFGNIGSKGEVKNLCVSGNVNISSDNAVSTGGIAGNADGKISGCSFSGSVNGIQDVGGIAGQAGLNSVIKQCINKAKVSGKENIGGIAGSCSYGNITECVNTANIGGETSINVGGIAGSITNYAVVTACYNTGSIIGNDYMGGIAGTASVCAAPQGCYNIGNIKSGMHAFGVLGSLSGTDYISVTKGSYYLTESAQTATDKTAQGLNSDSMKKSAFVSLLNAQAGATLFVMDLKEQNGGYPILSWQSGSADGGSDITDPEQPDILNVSFKLCIDTSDDNTPLYKDWIASAECTIPKNSTAYDLFRKMMNDYGYSFEANGNSYVSSVTTPDGTTLAELDKGPRSGWMYTINNEFPDYMATVKLKNNDEMCFFYTNDYKKTNWKPTDPTVIQVTRFIDNIGTVTLESADAIQTARDAYEMLNSEQKFSVANYETLLEAEEAYKKLLDDKNHNKPQPNDKYYDIYIETGKTLLKGNTPIVSSTGGEWVVLGLARSERISKKFVDGYYSNLVKTLNKNGSEKLHRNKSTENARAVIAVSSLGYDASDIGGYNLLKPLADMDYLKKQGVNGYIWALIAFDTRNYEIPKTNSVKNKTTREKLIKAILDEQIETGGWVLDDEAGDIDLTAMAVQALAPYADTDENVKSAIEKALTFLSKQQRSDGSFASKGKACCESCAQVIVALTSLGINPENDERFIKNGNSVLDALTDFYTDGAFKHNKNGSADDMATEQAYYALTSYYRLLNKQTSLYDMSDVKPNSNIPDNKIDKTTTSTTNSNKATENKNTTSVKATTHTSKKNTSKTSPQTGGNSALFVFAFACAGTVILVTTRKRKVK